MDAESNRYELYRDADGDIRVMSREEMDKHFPNTKVLSNDETAQCIQSWYENRRD